VTSRPRRPRWLAALAGGVALAFVLADAALSQGDLTVIEAERIVTGTAAPSGPGVILLRGGKIESVARALPAGRQPSVRLKAKVVTPGLIDARTTLGLAGLGQEDDDRDERSAPNTAHLRAIDAFNLQEPLLRGALQNGVTTVQAGPGRANSIGGQAGIFHTAGGSVADATLRFPSAVVLSLTEAAKTTYASGRARLNTRMANVGLIRQAFIDADQYTRRQKEAKPPDRDLKHEALAAVLGGGVPAIVTAERVDEIATALRLRDEFKFRLVLAGASDATLLAARLAAEQAPVLIGPPHEGPIESGTVQGRAQVPAQLHQAGVRFALASGDGAERPRLSLLQQAAAAVAAGLPADAALAAITIQPARILGIDDRVGAIEPGKDADLVLFDGDPLSYATRVTAVLIGGRVVFER
jgi:imidazolonepropionase-like amidohydrolase